MSSEFNRYVMRMTMKNKNQRGWWKIKNEQEEDRNWQCVEKRMGGESLEVDQKGIKRKITDSKS